MNLFRKLPTLSNKLNNIVTRHKWSNLTEITFSDTIISTLKLNPGLILYKEQLTRIANIKN